MHRIVLDLTEFNLYQLSERDESDVINTIEKHAAKVRDLNLCAFSIWYKNQHGDTCIVNASVAYDGEDILTMTRHCPNPAMLKNAFKLEE